MTVPSAIARFMRHLFTVENTYVRPDNGDRDCRECRRAAKARYRMRQAVA